MIPFYDHLEVIYSENRFQLGCKAAEDAAACIHTVLKEKDEIVCMFAAAPSQNEFLSALTSDITIPWEKIHGLNMDEYVGLSPNSKQSFSGFLQQSLFSKVKFASVCLINGMNDPEEECRRYSRLLNERPLDILFMGIGENGHIAFNDPGTSSFTDPESVKQVHLEHASRMQQIHDGCFSSLDEVPEYALTVTIPALMTARFVFCIVPGVRKAEAVSKMLLGPVTDTVPASVLRTKEHAKLYLDRESASLL